MNGARYLRGEFVLAFKVRCFSSAFACIPAAVPTHRSMPTPPIFDHTGFGFPADDYGSLNSGRHSITGSRSRSSSPDR
jgi:hypothetical protein